MKYAKRLLAVLMVLVLGLTVTGISAFAAEPPRRTYTTYTAFGDSVTTAFGIPGYFVVKAKYGTAEGRRVDGSYSDLLAKKLNIQGDFDEGHFFNESRSGWRSSELREMVDASYTSKDGELAKMLSVWMGSPTNPNTREQDMVRIADEIKKSDLITVDIGSNDLQLPVIMHLTEFLNPSANEDYKKWFIEDLLEQYGSEMQIIEQLTSTIAQIHGVTFAVNLLLQIFTESMQTFMTDYNVMMTKIHELNPDATLMAIGLYNPARSANLSEDIPINIGQLLSPIIAGMNTYISTLCPARQYYTYVDGWDTEVLGTVNLLDIFSGGSINSTGFGNFVLYIHPNEAGHQYLAEQIYKALPISGYWVKRRPLTPDYYVYLNDQIQYQYTGLAKNENGWWYARNGKVRFNYTGFAEYNGKLWYVKNGAVKFDTTGLVKDPASGNFYYVVGNEVKPGPALAKNDKGWWYVDETGKVNFSYTGFVSYNNKLWYVKNGGVKFDTTNVIKDPKTGYWYNVVGNEVKPGPTVAKNENGWFYIDKDGKVDFTFNGLASNKSGTWVIKNGCVNFNYYGKYNYKGKTYTIQQGRVE